jgi:site-specific DNA recombinase
VLSEAEHARVPFHFVSEPLDNTPEGQLIRFVKGYAAKIEHEKIRDRTIQGRRARVAAGMPMAGGKAPYGYQWADDRKSALVERAEEAHWVRWLFEKALGGWALRALATGLTERGVGTPTGRGGWTAATVRLMLHSTTYIGQHRALKYQTIDKRKTLRPWNEHKVLPCPALVDEGTFRAVQARLSDGKLYARRNNSDPTATLLRCGFGYCGSCGYRLAAQHHRGYGTWSYTCPNRGARGRTCPERPLIAARNPTEAGGDQRCSRTRTWM